MKARISQIVWLCKGVLIVLNGVGLFCVLVAFCLQLYLMGLSGGGYMGLTEVLLSLVLGAFGLFVALVCVIPSWFLRRYQKEDWRISVPLFLNFGTWLVLLTLFFLLWLGRIYAVGVA